MKKIILVTFLIFASCLVVFPSNAKAEVNKANSIASGNSASQVRTRYVKVRGKRYRVTYRTFTRNGRRYVKILSYRRA